MAQQLNSVQLSEDEIKEKAMKWIDGSIIGPRNELSNEDRVKIYNVIAGSYERDMVDIAQYQAHKMAAKFIDVYLKGNEEARILDIGCGTGLLAQELKKLSYGSLHGLDPSEEMLRRAAELGLYCTTYNQYFGLNSGLPQDHYDLAVAVSAFIPGHIEAKAVREMVNMVREGGYAMITMRSRYVVQDDDLSTLRSCIQQLVDEGKAQVVEDREFDKLYNRSDGDSGLLLVLKKL